MNTPTIAAALSSPPAQAGRAAGNSSDAENGPSFSHVLGDQHAAIEQQARTSTLPASGKTNQPAKTKADAENVPNDAEMAEALGEQGLSLPQIALSLAAHVMTGTNPGTADLPVESAAAAPAQTLPRGKADLATLLEKASPVRGEAPVKVDAQVPRSDAGIPGRFSVARPDEQAQLVLNNPVITEPPVSNNRATATQLRAPAMGSQPGNKPAGPAGKISDLIQDKADPTLAASATAALPDEARASFNAAPTYDIASLASLASLNTPGQSTSPAVLTGTSLAVSAPLQSPQWPSDFGRQFVMLSQSAGNQPQTAELRLDPPELGPIRITININDNIAHAVFVSAHASVRSAIENALPQLQQQLAQAGISLGQTNVSDQSQQQSAFEQSRQSAGKNASRISGSAVATGVESAVAHASARAIQNSNSLVDTFV